MKKRVLIFLLLTFVLIIFLYYPNFKYYFFQDDFFHFNISQARNFREFLNFFVGRRDVIFYRPISMQLFYFLGKKLFGLNPLPYHLFGMTLHLVNIFLIYILISKITEDKLFSLLVAFFYGVSGIHFMALYWIAAFHFLLGTLFFLLSFIFFLKGLEKSKNKYFTFSFLFFLCALLSEELTIILPFLIVLYLLIFLKKKINWFFEKKKFFLPFLFIIVPYVFYRFIIVPVPFEETYKIYIDFRSINNLLWDILWTLNIPENFRYQIFSLTRFKINPKFIADFYSINKRVWVFLAINIFLVYVFPIGIIVFSKFKKNKKRIFYFKTSIFGLLWFAFCLLPTIFLPLHQYPYFLTIAGIGFYLFFLSPLFLFFNFYKGRKSIIYSYLLMIGACWYFSSLINSRFTEETHWITQRARVSKIYTGRLKAQFPNPRPGSIIVLPEDEILQHSLMDKIAGFVLYDDSSINLTYGNFSTPQECLLIKENMEKNKKYKQTSDEDLNMSYDECLKRNNIFFLKND